MAKKQVVEFERVSGQEAHRQQVRLLAYQKGMKGMKWQKKRKMYIP